MEAFLRGLLETSLAGWEGYEIQNLGSKERLLRGLPSRLQGYRGRGMDDLRIVVLVDRDDDDCRALKARLEAMARGAGLRTRSADPLAYQVVNRVVVEELEAWLLGDPQALRAAYPRLPATFERTEPFRDPDAIAGGTWEALERLLQGAGHLRGRLRKGEVAGEVARYMVPERNVSGSFRAFWTAIAEMIQKSPGGG